MYRILEQNPILFGKKYFGHHFRDRSPYFHWILIDQSYKNRYFAVQSPRGSAKSTILAFLKVTHRICFKQKRFIVIVQNTYKKAVGTLEGIKDEVRWNEELRRDFGVTLEKDAEGDTIFRHADGFRTRVLCKGVEQIGSIRGEKFGAYRPDYILGDDMEDDEMVKSPERRQSLKELFNNALIPAGDTKCLDVDIIGTILHDDSLMADLVNPKRYTQYVKKFFKARYLNKETGEEESLWPERWTIEELNEMERRDPMSFAKEMQGDPSSGLAGTFDRKDFREWRMLNGEYCLHDSEGQVCGKGSLRDCRWAIACDLAWEEGRTNDFSVAMPGFITPDNDILVDTYLCKRGLRPDELFEWLFVAYEKMEKITGSVGAIGFEKAKLEKVVKWLLQKEMRIRNKWLILKDLLWDADKLQRIYTRLQPRYAQHVIYHKSGMNELESQLIRIPNGAHDDLADCLQGICQLLSYPKQIKTTPKDTEYDKLKRLKKMFCSDGVTRGVTRCGGISGVGRRNWIPAEKSFMVGEKI
jgi:hypothetical protein